MKQRVFHAHQKIQEVRSVDRVQRVFSTMKSYLKKSPPDDSKILMTNATKINMCEVIDLYTLRWQIELFFKEKNDASGYDDLPLVLFSS